MSIKNGVYTALTDEMESPTIIEVKEGLFRVVGYLNLRFESVIVRGSCPWDRLEDMNEKTVLEFIKAT